MATAPPPALRNHQQWMLAERRRTLATLRRAWAHLASPAAGVNDLLPGVQASMVNAVSASQVRIARRSATATLTASRQVGMTLSPQEWVINPSAFAGTTGDGRALTGALQHTSARVIRLLDRGIPKAQALRAGWNMVSRAAGTALADTSREAAVTTAHGARLTHKVWVLGPNPCGRCIVRAGGVVRIANPRPRHPNCQCEAVFADRATAEGFATSAQEYLEKLDAAGDEVALRRALGSQANVDAWRAGADPVRIINSYRDAWLAARQRSTDALGQTLRRPGSGGLARRLTEARSPSISHSDFTAQTRNLMAPYGGQRPMPSVIFARADSEGWSRAEIASELIRWGWTQPVLAQNPDFAPALARLT